MNSSKDFHEVVSVIVKEDSRFDKGAYFFLKQALDHTLEQIKQSEKPRVSNHVSGQELLDGIRRFALDQYGPMTLTLLEHWGVTRCEDFGDIVFNLVDYGVLGKTAQDRKEDFTGGYSFREAFEKPFLPARRSRNRKRVDDRN